MRKPILIGIGCILILAAGAWARPSKQELVSRPVYLDNAREPKFQKVDPQSIQNRLMVVSARSTAMIGFNMPKVMLYLPRIDNSAYAVVTFDEPRVLDKNGTVVPFELEAGGYDEHTFSHEIRLAGKDGEPLTGFDRVRGTGTIRYPLQITTRVVKRNKARGAEVVLDGPFVTYIDRNIADMGFLASRLGPVRAYDEKGRRLKRYGYESTVTRNSRRRRTLAFCGEIAEVRIDTVTRWAIIRFDYVLPPVKPLAEQAAGQPARRPAVLKETPGGRVRFSHVRPKGQADGEKGTAAAKTRTRKSPGRICLATAVLLYPEADILKLIARGADVNARDEAGRTPLFTAVYRRASLRIFQALTDAGADVNAAADDGRTPLDLARAMKYEEIVRFLTSRGSR